MTERTSSDRISSLRLIWLQAFLVAIETGNLAETGLKLGCSQPMAGRYIKQLKEWYGAEIFESGKVSTLTRAGQELQEAAKAVLSVLENVRQTDRHEHAADASSDSRTAKLLLENQRKMNDIKSQWEELGRLLKGLEPNPAIPSLGINQNHIDKINQIFPHEKKSNKET